MSKIIGLDLDGVILDFTDIKIQTAKEFGFTITPQETHSEIIEKVIPKETLDKIKQLIYADKNYALRTPLVDGAFSGLNFLKEKNIRYFLISKRRSPETAIVSLKDHNLWPNYFNENNTYFVLRAEDKNIRAKELGVTHFLDDETRVLNILSDVPNKFLFDLHQIFKDTSTHQTITSWPEFISRLD